MKATPYAFSMAETLDLRKLRQRREERGLTQTAMAEGMGLTNSTYRSLEIGAHNMRLYQFRQICILLDLDPLEICELLRLPAVNRHDVRIFRLACRRLKTTPGKALRDFIKVFCQSAREVK